MSARRSATSSDGPPAAAGAPAEAPAEGEQHQPPETEASERSRSSAPPSDVPGEEKPRTQRTARIVAAGAHDRDARLLERDRLLGRFMACEGRGAITRAADQYLRAGFDFPVEQPVQLQLLEHLDEGLVRGAIDALRTIVTSEPPLKRPIFEQRLKRLEDSAEEEATRSAASELRRVLRN
jgi:hypothetical protein